MHKSAILLSVCCSLLPCSARAELSEANMVLNSLEIVRWRESSIFLMAASVAGTSEAENLSMDGGGFCSAAWMADSVPHQELSIQSVWNLDLTGIQEEGVEGEEDSPASDLSAASPELCVSAARALWRQCVASLEVLAAPSRPGGRQSAAGRALFMLPLFGHNPGCCGGQCVAVSRAEIADECFVLLPCS